MAPPPEDPRRLEAVRVTRFFLPLYLGLTAFLFVPPLLRLGGVNLPAQLQSMVALPTFVGMVLSFVYWYHRLVTLGQWRAGGGPRFSLLTAVLEGRWAGEDDGAPVARALPTSPLGLVALDVAELSTALGPQPLAEALRAALREAEAVTDAVALRERIVPADALTRARAAVGQFEDHVVQLVKVIKGGGAAGPEWAERMENDLLGLRAAGDALRHTGP